MRHWLIVSILGLFLLCPASSEDYLVPLDDRPANRLFVQQIARIGQPEPSLLVAPRHLLGRLYSPGRCEELERWLSSRAKPGDTVILSADMWLYGGLVASRTAEVTPDQVEQRLASLRKLAGRGVKLRVLATIPRLSLRTSDLQAPYERKIANWSAKAGLPSATEILEGAKVSGPKGVPEKALREYLSVRRRNLVTLLTLVEMVAAGELEMLVLGQDDSHKNGLHKHEQSQLRELISQRQVETKAKLLSGIDELSMVMVSGLLAQRSQLSPGVRVVYSDPEWAQKVPPLETLPLGQMVDQHLALAGAHQVDNESADVDLYIYVPSKKPWGLPGEEKRPQAQEFVSQIKQAMESGRRVAVADLSLVNRMDPFLAESVLETINFPALSGFASWNTPANTTGTVAAQLVCHRIAQLSPHWSFAQRLESEKTHQAFLMARLIDDYLYQTLIRDQVKAKTKGLSSKAEPLLNLFGPVGLEVRLNLVEWANQTFERHFLGKSLVLAPHQRRVEFRRSKLEVVLPWPRIFEVEARLDLRLSDVTDQTQGGTEHGDNGQADQNPHQQHNSRLKNRSESL